MMNHDHEDYNNASINAFVFKHAVNIKRAYARTSWATDFMSLCCLKNNWSDWVWGEGGRVGLVRGSNMDYRYKSHLVIHLSMQKEFQVKKKINNF